MYIKLAVAIVAALQPFILMGDEVGHATSFQSDGTIPNEISSGEKSSMSDREKAGLRGPVQQCTEERTTPAFENFPATSYTTTTKYSPEGRILQSTTSNSVESNPPEFSTTYTYDSAGRLKKAITTSPDSPTIESTYNYDDNHRLISITGHPAQVFTFQYDDQGRKARVLTPQVQLDSPLLVTTSISIGVIEGEDPYLPIPSGGQAKTLFNQNDEPIEWQIIDANGNVLNKLIRTYDENGRVTELRYTMENVLLSLPAEAREEISAQPGAAEELAKQFAAFFGEQRNFMRTAYKYDANGRLTQKHTYMGPSMETVTKIAYNDHSDKSEEQTITIGDPNDPGKEPSRESPPPALPPSHTSETRYSYKYDNFGNWTEQTTTSPANPNYPTVIRRVLTYY
jgi:YD repeat-containing protein